MSPLANPLAQLNDIIAPTAASPWPPAPIYWLLFSALLLLLIASVYLFKRTQPQRQKQQRALTQLQRLQNEQADFIALNQLLKGVTLNHFPRQQVASLHGEQWFDFLQQYAATPLFADKQAFLRRLYQDSEQPCCDDDFVQAKRWIKSLPKQLKKQHKEGNRHV